VELLSYDQASTIGHLKFNSTYSSDSFIDWLSLPMNYFSGIFHILANSSKITFSAESEPFMPSSILGVSSSIDSPLSF
jgi:hypothetical protein